MKHILLIILMICTLSGCGLFKKTSKDIQKQEESTKIEQKKESVKETKEQSNEHSNKKTNEQIQERDKRDIDSETTLEADRIRIDKNGNIIADGNAKLNNKLKDKGESEKNANKDVVEDSSKQTIIDMKEESKESVKEEIKQKDYSKEVKSETDFWGVIAGGIVIALLVAGGLWYFGIRPKK